MSALVLLTFVVAALLGMPLAFALGFGVLVALPAAGIDPAVLPQRMMHAINAFPLMAIPLFMVAGELMVRGGIAERLIDLANAFVGRVAGGLAHVTMLAGAGMASVSGAAVADASALGTLMIRQLSKVYGVGFSAAVVAAAGNIAPIIPPSNAMIVYAYVAGSTVSVGGLFLAGLVPGLLLTVGMMAIAAVMATVRGYPPTGDPISLVRIGRELARSWIVLLMPIVVIGGIAGGAFTATEGAAIAVVYALFAGLFVTRQLKLRDIPACLVDAAVTTAIVGAMIAFASAVTFILTIDLLPARLSQALRAITTDPLVFCLLVTVLLIVVGMFLESNAAYVMLVPLLHPIALQYGLDPLHFAFLFVFNLVLGMLTPPVGVVLFVICSIAHISVGEIMRHLWPFLLYGFALLLACILWPPLVTALPRALGY
jgi:tripartite ATP-independent transporter DctM subunit